MRGKIVYGETIRYYIEGKEVSKQEFDEAFPTKPLHVPVAMMQTSKAWPRKSDAYGVPNVQLQAVEAEEYYKKIGVPTEICRETGKAIIRDNAHQRNLLKATGGRNNDGGYGQITG